LIFRFLSSILIHAKYFLAVGESKLGEGSAGDLKPVRGRTDDTVFIIGLFQLVILRFQELYALEQRLLLHFASLFLGSSVLEVIFELMMEKFIEVDTVRQGLFQFRGLGDLTF
jgi:hypothetical protein